MFDNLGLWFALAQSYVIQNLRYQVMCLVGLLVTNAVSNTFKKYNKRRYL